jgi:hypothetical protein
MKLSGPSSCSGWASLCAPVAVIDDNLAATGWAHAPGEPGQVRRAACAGSWHKPALAT